MFFFTSLVTLAAVLFYAFLGLRVGQARAQYHIAAPATVGHPAFERRYRIQMNTLEWMPIFLPSLWLCAFYISDEVAGFIGLVWIAGRILYTHGYEQAPERRHLGFNIQAVAAAALFFGALIDIVLRMTIGD